MQHIRLIGQIETPIVHNWSKYQFPYKDKMIKVGISRYNCGNNLLKPYLTYAIKNDYGKISRNDRPYIFHCYSGFVHLDFEGTKDDLQDLININQLGKYKSEGMGRINWLKWFVFDDNKFSEIEINKPKNVKLKKLKIDEVPEADYKLLTACLVHDLVHIKDKHPSKLFGFNDLIINDDEINFIVHNHHSKIKHPLIKRLQKADQRATIVNRKKERKIISSIYNPIRKGCEDKVDLQTFHKIKEEIEKRLDNFVELYEFVWNCKELDYLVEAQDYPETSLREHLLLTMQFALG